MQQFDLAEQLALLDRRAKDLAEIAGDDDAVERRDDAGARELLLDQRQLCFGKTVAAGRLLLPVSLTGIRCS